MKPLILIFLQGYALNITPRHLWHGGIAPGILSFSTREKCGEFPAPEVLLTEKNPQSPLQLVVVGPHRLSGRIYSQHHVIHKTSSWQYIATTT